MNSSLSETSSLFVPIFGISFLRRSGFSLMYEHHSRHWFGVLLFWYILAHSSCSFACVSKFLWRGGGFFKIWARVLVSKFGSFVVLISMAMVYGRLFMFEGSLEANGCRWVSNCLSFSVGINNFVVSQSRLLIS